jgi:hypothetical protein
MQTLFDINPFASISFANEFAKVSVKCKLIFEIQFSQNSSSRNNRKFEIVFLINLLDK